MEPVIELDQKIRVLDIDYPNILATKIKIVCSKINFSYEGIRWIIFDPALSDINGEKPNQIRRMLIGKDGRDYGACNRKDIIWISTLAIKREFQNYFFNKMNKTLDVMIRNKRDFLANVILDELAHIATGCDHGSLQYNAKLNEFYKCYYS